MAGEAIPRIRNRSLPLLAIQVGVYDLSRVGSELIIGFGVKVLRRRGTTSVRTVQGRGGRTVSNPHCQSEVHDGKIPLLVVARRRNFLRVLLFGEGDALLKVGDHLLPRARVFDGSSTARRSVGHCP